MPFTTLSYLIRAYAGQNGSRNYLDSAHNIRTGIGTHIMSHKRRIAELQQQYYGSELEEPPAYSSGTWLSPLGTTIRRGVPDARIYLLLLNYGFIRGFNL